MEYPSRPAIRYYGGKWKIAKWVNSFFPDHKTYIEGCFGAGSVFFHKVISRNEIINDTNGEIISLFRVLRNPADAKELRRLLHLTPYARDEFEACYEYAEDPIEQARRTVVLAMMSHNPAKSLNRKRNGFRTSSKGHHIMPSDFSRHTDALEFITRRLKNAIIENKTAEEICTQHDAWDTLHYLDFPYPGKTRSRNRNLYKHEMREMADHEKAFKWISQLKGKVVVSGYNCDEYDDWYVDQAGYVKKERSAQTGAFCGGAKEAKATEVLWLSPNIHRPNEQLSLTLS